MGASTIDLTLNPGESDEVSITVNGPPGPTQPELLPEWVTQHTADLSRVSYRTVNNEVWQWRMTLDGLTTAQLNALIGFYRTNAEGPTNTWRLTHTDGTNYTVRFIEMPRPTRVSDNEWSCDIALELDGQLNS